MASLARVADIFLAASLGSLAPFGLVPGLHGAGYWVDVYFLLITVQCGGTVVFLNVLAWERGGPSTPSGKRLSTSLGLLTLAFVAMGVIDGILGVYSWCPGACPFIQGGFLLALGSVFALERGALQFIRGLVHAPRNRVLLMALSLWTLALGALGYWALGWSLFVPFEADAAVLLYKLGPLSISTSGAGLLTVIALAPLAHLTTVVPLLHIIRSGSPKARIAFGHREGGGSA